MVKNYAIHKNNLKIYEVLSLEGNLLKIKCPFNGKVQGSNVSKFLVLPPMPERWWEENYKGSVRLLPGIPSSSVDWLAPDLAYVPRPGSNFLRLSFYLTKWQDAWIFIPAETKLYSYPDGSRCILHVLDNGKNIYVEELK